MTQTLPESIEWYLEHGLSPHGWMDGKTKGPALAFHVLEHKPSCAVEIGVYSGRSLLTIGLAMKENGFGVVHGIDPWAPEASIEGYPINDANHGWWKAVDHDMIMKECVNGIERLKVKDHVELWRHTSAEVVKLFAGGIDLVHIDGNHSEASALFDVENWVPLVKTGGFVWADDCDWLSTKPAQSKLAETCRLVSMVGTCGIYVKV